LKSRWTIRKKLLVLMLLTLAPFAVVGAVWSGWLLSEEQERVRSFTLDMARFAALEVEDVVNQAEALLIGLAEAPPFRRPDPTTADALLSRLHPRHPFYENIIAVDTKGQMYGTGLVQLRQKVFVGDRAWFQEAMRSDGLTVGDPIFGRVKGKPVVMLAYPVKDDSGRRVGTVSVALGLLLIQKVLAEVPIPGAGIVTVFNPDGRVLARTADPEAWVLKDLSETELFKGIAPSGSGFFEGTGLDEVRRVMAFARLKRAPWIVMVTIPSSHAYTRFWQNFRVQAFSLLGALSLAMLLAGLFGRGLIRSFARLTERARAVARGSLERGGAPEGAEREVAELFESFDRMVDDLKAGHAENTRLYEAAREQAQELTALHEVSATLTTTLDLTAILEAIADSALKLIGAQRCAVFELDPCDQRLYPRVIRGMAPDLVAPVKLGQGAAGVAASSHQPFFSPDVERYPPPMYDEPAGEAGTTLRGLVLQRGCRAVLAVPLVSKETVFGTISIYWDHVRASAERETRLLTAFARQAAVAIENARLYEAARGRIREMELLLDVAGILGSTLEMTPLLKRIARKTAEVCQVERCTIELWDKDGKVIPLMSQFADGRVDRDLWQKFRNAEPYRANEIPAYARMIGSKAPVVIDDVTATDLIPREWMETFGLKSYLLVPLIRKGRVVGSLGLDYATEKEGFTPEQVSLATTIASQVALAVENVRLLEAERSQARRVEALREIAVEITGTLDLERLFRLIISRAVELVGAHSGTVYLLDESGRDLVPKSWWTLGEWMREKVHRLGEGATGQAARTKQGVIVNDYLHWPHRRTDILERVPITATISAPMLVQERVVGVITLNAVEPGRVFRLADLGLLSMFAVQAAVAIETARLHSEIQGARDFLQSIIENSADAIITTDTHGRFTFWSPAAKEIFGYGAEEIIGRSIADYYRGGLEEARAVMKRLRAEGRVLNYETVFRTRDGRWVEANTSMTLLSDESGAEVGTLGIVKDVTELKRLEGEMVRSERLRVLGAMAAGVAHDFNNLLAIILGHAQLLERHLSDSDSLERLAIIQKAVEDGVETIRRIQEFARLRSDRPFATVDVNALVKEAAALTRSRWRDEADAAGVSIEVEVNTGEVKPVAGNPAELREVLVNLILNGLDAMPHGGRLEITTEALGDAVFVKVKDTGIGMSEEVRKRLFEPFFTTKAGRGTGLGLSVAYGIVTRHGGEISVESRQGEGSTFTIKLPVGEGVYEEPGESLHLPPLEPMSVLVIDDEKAVRDLLIRFLTVEGHSVVAAPDGPAALERFAPGEFDLVVTDLGMPGMSGWEVASAIKAKDPRVPVIMLTGWGDQLPQELIESSGIDRVVAKPVGFEELMGVISSVIRQR
jgi:PAS domain S-box-containing protein